MSVHPKVRLMRERLGELLEAALEARDQRRAARILQLYYKGRIPREEAFRRLRALRDGRPGR